MAIFMLKYRTYAVIAQIILFFYTYLCIDISI